MFVLRAGAILLGYGLVALNPWITLWGLTLTMGAKLWTFDRMVWLWREAGPVHEAHPGPAEGRPTDVTAGQP